MVQNNHPAGDDGQLQPPFQVVDVVFRRRDMLVEPMAAAVMDRYIERVGGDLGLRGDARGTGYKARIRVGVIDKSGI